MKSIVLIVVVATQLLQCSAMFKELTPLETLEKFVNEQLFQLWMPLNFCTKLEDDPQIFFDEILQRLALQIQAGGRYAKKLVEGLAEATDLKGLAQSDNQPAQDVAVRYALEQFKASGNASHQHDGLAPVEVFKRSLSQKLANEIDSMSKYDRAVLEKAIMKDYGPPEGPVSRFKRGINLGRFAKRSIEFISKRAFSGIFKQAVKLGVNFLDGLQMCPEFLMHMPIVGEQIAKLKKMGEPMYKIVEFFRYANLLYKLNRCPSDKSPLDQDFNGSDCSGVANVDDDTVENAKRVISRTGSFAVESILVKLKRSPSGKHLSIDASRELSERTIFSVLTYVWPQTLACGSLSDMNSPLGGTNQLEGANFDQPL